jgi:hypothetical protein
MSSSRLLFRAASVALLVLVASSCDRPPPHQQKNKPPPPPARIGAESWLGRWTGPEGTFLQVTRSGDRYEVTIRDLDGPKTYPGNAAGDHLEFVRNGHLESIRATNGQETGMKWLLEKQNCLTIRSGEGFCRD